MKRCNSVLVWCIALSFTLHLGFQRSFAISERDLRRPEPALVVDIVVPPPVPEPPPDPAISEPEPVEPESLAPAPTAVRGPRKPLPEVPTAVQHDASPMEQMAAELTSGAEQDGPIDLSRMTLSGSKTGWSVVRTRGRGQQKRGHSTPLTPAAREEAPLVPLADLSKRPVPPALGAELRRNYPKAARLRGAEGRAVVRARIEADGRVRNVRVVQASAQEFGAACRDTLQSSRWTPPRDMQGRPVATTIMYTCEFEVDG